MENRRPKLIGWKRLGLAFFLMSLFPMLYLGSRMWKRAAKDAKERQLRQHFRKLTQAPRPVEFPCQPRPCQFKPKTLWKSFLLEVHEGSPRAIDLTGDGVLDVVVGGGSTAKNCFVYAVDGRTGARLWSRQFGGDVYGTPLFVDANRDGVPDVVATGRFNTVYMLHGRTGQTLWSLREKNPKLRIPKSGFNTPVLVSDLDKDGAPDFMVVQGGALNDTSIIAGRVYLVSSRTGRVLRWIETPDKREIYSVPAFRKDRVFLGTGGERIPGHMIALQYPSLKKIWSFPSQQKGWIASPLLVRSPQRPHHDVIGATFDGSLLRLDGNTGKKRWATTLKGRESYSSPAVGRFQRPEQYDVVASFSRGVYPVYKGSILVWLDGQSGKKIAQRALGSHSLSSPLVADLNGDGYDEVIVSAVHIYYKRWEAIKRLLKLVPDLENDAFQKVDAGAFPLHSTTNNLLVLDGKTKEVLWSKSFPGFSAATPLLKDIDGNGKLDLIYVYLNHMVRLEFQRSVPEKDILWNQFRGPQGDGVFPAEQDRRTALPPKERKPLLLDTAKAILRRINRQESRKDATCWTTVRMMEHFYARKPLQDRASLLKIEASKLLLYQLWRKASASSKASSLRAEDIRRVTPALLNDSLQILSARKLPMSSSLYQRIKVRDYHKVTENWRSLLSIAMESMAGDGLFAKGFIDIKPLEKSGAEQLALASTALTMLLLSKANKAAEQNKHRTIRVRDIQEAYRRLLPSLGFTKHASSTNRAFRQSVGNRAYNLSLLRKLSLENMRLKVASLRSWNQKVWKKKGDDAHLLSLLQHLTSLKLSVDDVKALIDFLKATFRPFALGASQQGSKSQMAPSLGPQFDPKHLLRMDTSGQAPKRRSFLPLLWVANNLHSVFPFTTKPNGDVVFYAANEVLQRGKETALFKKYKRTIVGPALDAIRDTTLHWTVLYRLWRGNPSARPLDPFAAELLSERASELAFYLLKEAEAFAKKPQQYKNLREFLEQFRRTFYPVASALQTHQWGEQQKAIKKKLLQKYRHRLFQSVSLKKAGIAKKPCPLSSSWLRDRQEPQSDPKVFVSPSKVDTKYLGLAVHMGGGIAVGDYDNDGKVDLFFAGEGCNRLYRNLGAHRFEDVTQKVGIRGLFPDSRQALFVDVDNDGRLDLFVLHTSQPGKLFLQQPNGTFKDHTKSSGLRTTIGAFSATFFDYDNDGLLDLYVGYYGAYFARDRQLPTVDGTNGRPNALYRNLGGGRFQNVTQKAGVGSRSWTLAVASLDVNQDGRMDLWLANDFGFDQLYLNQGNGTFRDVSQSYRTNDRGSGMNVSFTDINGDGYWDVYVSVIDMFSKSIRFVLPTPKSLVPLDQRILATSFYLSGNQFFVSAGKSRYKSEEAKYFEPAQRGWGWSAAFFDYENDGDHDMYFANGWRKHTIAHSQRNHMYLFHKGLFFRHPGPSPALYKGNSRSGTAVDLTGRGLMSLVLNDYRKGPRLFRNLAQPRNRWLKVKLRGKRNNRFGVGATVKVEVPGLRAQRKQVTCGINYLSQEDTTLTFGLGRGKVASRITVFWPGGKAQVLKGPLRANTLYTIQED